MMALVLNNFFTHYPFLSQFLNEMEDSIYIVDLESRFIFINKAVEKVEGIRLEEVKGKTIQEVYRFQNTPLLSVLKHGEPIDDFTYHYSVNGQEVLQICRAFPIIFKNRMIGAYAIQRDVTSYKDMIVENLFLHEKLYPSDKKTDRANIPSCFDKIIGEHPSFLDCVSMAASAAKTDSSILLTGPTGSGKELFAHCIHEASPRSTGPFLAVNCAAIPEALLESILFGTTKGAYTGAVDKTGIFEQAAGGTLFLDEINSMPLSSQSKLLRVLEEKELNPLGGSRKIKTDVRIISSSNFSPQSAVGKMQLREDLFYRIAVVNVAIPSLDSRKSDILLLANHFIQEYNARFDRQVEGITKEVQYFFLMFPWPGNVRQLKHCIESAMNFVHPQDRMIRKEHIPKYLFSEFHTSSKNHSSFLKNSEKKKADGRRQLGDNGEDTVFDDIQKNEKTDILNALLKARGNVTQAAKIMNISRQSLIYRMKKYDIKRK